MVKAADVAVPADQPATKFDVPRGVPVEQKLHHFFAEASELGIQPGQVPTRLTTDLGNGNDFLLIDYSDHRFEYTQSLGCIKLTVWND